MRDRGFAIQEITGYGCYTHALSRRSVCWCDNRHGYVIMEMDHGGMRWITQSSAELSEYFDGLVQERHNSSAIAMELCLSYINLWIWEWIVSKICTWFLFVLVYPTVLGRFMWFVYLHSAGLVHWHWGVIAPVSETTLENRGKINWYQNTRKHRAWIMCKIDSLGSACNIICK